MEKKGKPWEESINVPFIIRWPGVIEAGKKTDSLLAGIDLYPTLCGLSGLPAPQGKDGEDFSEFMRGKGSNPRESILIMRGPQDWGWRGIRTSRYTYAWYWGKKARQRDFGIWAKRQYGKPGGERAMVLYDNEKDPYQMNNLIFDPAARKIKEKLHARLVEMLKEVDDPIVEKLAKAEL
jgi:arylsulfatase A-like enzyme